MYLFKISLLALIPAYLSAGFFDWFYTSSNKVTQFECPNHCGKWGTEGMRQVEWEAVLALWELDRLGHALKGEEFPFQELPKSLNSPWYQNFKEKGVSVSLEIVSKKVITENKSFYDEIYYSSKDCDFIKFFDVWTIDHILDVNGDLQGIEYTKWLWNETDDEDDEDDEYTEYRFNSLKEINRFCTDIHNVLFPFYRQYVDDFYKCDIEWAERIIAFQDKMIIRSKDAIKEKSKIINENPNTKPWIQQEIRRKESHQKELEWRSRKLQEAQEELSCQSLCRNRFHQVLEHYTPLIESKLGCIRQAYCAIWDYCIAHHNAPAAYYNRALYYFDEGLNMNCIEDIKKFIKMTPPEMLSEEMRAKLEFRKGKAECELDLFEDAIHTLSKYIAAYPRRKEAYLERAIAYLEKGNIPEALQDFIDSQYEMRPIESTSMEEFECGIGLMKGMGKGALEALNEARLLIASSASGLSHGLIALVTAPQETSREFVHACQEVVAVIKENGLVDTLMPHYPEIYELFSGEPLSYFRQGELMGQVIGHLGIDYALLKGGAKAVKAVRKLRKANAILTLERMSKSIQVEQQMINHTREWWSRSAPIIDELRAARGTKIDKEIFRAFRNQSLSESQVRKILHHAGFKTFPRPKGIPHDCKIKISKKSGGMVYIKAGTTEEQNILVRVMPGDPKSPNPLQQNPYVIQRKGADAISKDGCIVKKGSEKAHILLSEFEFKSW